MRRGYNNSMYDVIDLTPQLNRYGGGRSTNNNVIDLTLSDDDDEDTMPTRRVQQASNPTTSSQTSFLTPSNRVAATAVSAPATVSENRITAPTPASSRGSNRAQPASEQSKAKALSGKLKIKLEFEPKAFGEANDGEEVVEVANPEEGMNDTTSTLTGSKRSAAEAFDVDNDDGEEIQIVGGNMNFASNMPHPRESCTVYRFVNPKVGAKTDKNLQHCPNCYCYVCQVKAELCSSWTTHCQANCRESKWKQLRENLNSPLLSMFTEAQRAKYISVIGSMVATESSQPRPQNRHAYPYPGYSDDDDEDDDDEGGDSYDEDDYDDDGNYYGAYGYSTAQSRMNGEIIMMLNAFEKCMPENTADGYAVCTVILTKLLAQPPSHYLRRINGCLIHWYISPFRTPALLQSMRTEMQKSVRNTDYTGILTELQSVLDDPSLHFGRTKLFFNYELPKPCLLDLVSLIFTRISAERLVSGLSSISLGDGFGLAMFCKCLEYEGQKYVDIAKQFCQVSFYSAVKVDITLTTIKIKTLVDLLLHLLITEQSDVMVNLFCFLVPYVFSDIDSDAAVTAFVNGLDYTYITATMEILNSRSEYRVQHLQESAPQTLTDRLTVILLLFRVVLTITEDLRTKEYNIHQYHHKRMAEQPNPFVYALCCNVLLKLMNWLKPFPDYPYGLVKLIYDIGIYAAFRTNCLDLLFSAELCRIPTIQKTPNNRYIISNTSFHFAFSPKDFATHRDATHSLVSRLPREEGFIVDARVSGMILPSFILPTISGDLVSLWTASPDKCTFLLKSLWKCIYFEFLHAQHEVHDLVADKRKFLLQLKPDILQKHFQTHSIVVPQETMILLSLIQLYLSIEKELRKAATLPLTERLARFFIPAFKKQCLEIVTASFNSAEDMDTLQKLVTFHFDHHASAADATVSFWHVWRLRVLSKLTSDPQEGRQFTERHIRSWAIVLQLQCEKFESFQTVDGLLEIEATEDLLCWEENRRPALYERAASELSTSQALSVLNTKVIPRDVLLRSLLWKIVMYTSSNQLKAAVQVHHTTLSVVFTHLICEKCHVSSEYVRIKESLLHHLIGEVQTSIRITNFLVHAVTNLGILGVENWTSISSWVDKMLVSYKSTDPIPVGQNLVFLICSILASCSNEDFPLYMQYLLPTIAKIVEIESSHNVFVSPTNNCIVKRAKEATPMDPYTACFLFLLDASHTTFRKANSLCANNSMARAMMNDVLSVVEKVSKALDPRLILTMDIEMHGWEGLVNNWSTLEFTGKYKNAEILLLVLCDAVGTVSPTSINTVLANNLALFAVKCLFELRSVSNEVRTAIGKTLGQYIRQGAYMQRFLGIEQQHLSLSQSQSSSTSNSSSNGSNQSGSMTPPLVLSQVQSHIQSSQPQPPAQPISHTAKTFDQMTADAAKLLLYAVQKQPKDGKDIFFVEIRSWECLNNAQQRDKVCRLFLDERQPAKSFLLMLSFNSLPSLFPDYIAALCGEWNTSKKFYSFDDEKAQANMKLLADAIELDHIHPQLKDVALLAPVTVLQTVVQILQKDSNFMCILRSLCWIRLRAGSVFSETEHNAKFNAATTCITIMVKKLSTLTTALTTKHNILELFLQLPITLVRNIEVLMMKVSFFRTENPHFTFGFMTPETSSLGTIQADATSSLIVHLVKYFTDHTHPISLCGTLKCVEAMMRVRNYCSTYKSKFHQFAGHISKLLTGKLLYSKEYSSEESMSACGLPSAFTEAHNRSTQSVVKITTFFDSLYSSYGGSIANEMLYRPFMVLLLSYDPEKKKQPFQRPLGNLVASKTKPIIANFAAHNIVGLVAKFCRFLQALRVNQAGINHLQNAIILIAKAFKNNRAALTTIDIVTQFSGYLSTNEYESLVRTVEAASCPTMTACASILQHIAIYCVEEMTSQMDQEPEIFRCFEYLEKQPFVNRMRIELMQHKIVSLGSFKRTRIASIPAKKIWPPLPTSPSSCLAATGTNYAFYWSILWRLDQPSHAIDTIYMRHERWIEVIQQRPPYKIHTVTVNGLKVPALTAATNTSISTSNTNSTNNTNGNSSSSSSAAMVVSSSTTSSTATAAAIDTSITGTHTNNSSSSNSSSISSNNNTTTTAAANSGGGGGSSSAVFVEGTTDPLSVILDHLLPVIRSLSNYVRNNTMTTNIKSYLQNAVKMLCSVVKLFRGPDIAPAFTKRLNDEITVMLKNVKSKKAVYEILLVLQQQ